MIELLVVIAIIVLLLAILLPSLQRARNIARAVVCQSNLKQWGTTLNIYIEESDGKLPPFVKGISLLRGAQVIDGDASMAPLKSVNTKGIALCPNAGRNNYDVNSISNYRENKDKISWNSGTTFTTWKILEPTPSFLGSYGFNSYLFDTLHIKNIYNMETIFSFPILLDSDAPISNIVIDIGPPSKEGTACCYSFINRHNGYVNGLFMDWTVRKIGLKELWTLKWNKDFDTANRWTLAGGVQPEDWPEWMRGFKDY